MAEYQKRFGEAAPPADLVDPNLDLEKPKIEEPVQAPPPVIVVED